MRSRRSRSRRSARVPRSTRRRMRSVVRRPLSTNVHKFVRWASASLDPAVEPLQLSCNFGSSGLSALGINFRLSDVAVPTEFTALWDQYKILGVKVYFDYSPDVAGTAYTDGNIAFYPKLWIKRDYDDSATPTLANMAQSNQTRCLRFTATRTTKMISLAPRYLTEIYNSSISTAFAPGRGAWIDCGNPSVPHYGLKMIAQGIPSVNLGAITIRVKYTLLFKNVR